MSQVRQQYACSWVSVDGVVRAAIEQNLRSSALSFDSFTARVVDHYVKHVPANQRTYPVNQSGDAFADNRLNSRKLARTINLDGDLRMPAVLVPSLIAALDDPWRSDTKTAVMQLIAPRRLRAVSAAGAALDTLQDLMRENGEALLAFMAVARDGLADDSTTSLLDARTQLLQLIQEGERAVQMLEAELQNRGVATVA